MDKTKILLIFLLTWKRTDLICRSLQGERTCCHGYFWNKETSACEKCPLGYHSVNCSKMCKYPSYGEDCQMTCKCAVYQCDYKYGCKHSNGITGDVSTVDLGLIKTTSGTSERTTNVISYVNMPHFIFYPIVIFLGLLFVLCSLFYGTYIYIHCIKQAVISGSFDPSNAREGYSGLGVAVVQQNDPINNPEYLDPLDLCKVDYVEIAYQDSNETSCL